MQADCAVEIDGNAYSVPWRLIGETVRATLMDGVVRIHHGITRAFSHSAELLYFVLPNGVTNDGDLEANPIQLCEESIGHRWTERSIPLFQCEGLTARPTRQQGLLLDSFKQDNISSNALGGRLIFASNQALNRV